MLALLWHLFFPFRVCSPEAHQCGLLIWDLQLCNHRFGDLHMIFANPGDFFEFLMYDQAGSPSATGICGAGQVTPLFDSRKCNGQPLAQRPQVLVCRMCVRAFRLLCCTVVSGRIKNGLIATPYDEISSLMPQQFAGLLPTETLRVLASF